MSGYRRAVIRERQCGHTRSFARNTLTSALNVNKYVVAVTAPVHRRWGPLVTDRVRAGIIGVRFMGTVHARAVRRSGGVVSRTVGSTPASSREAVERLAPEFPTDTIQELLAADDVDVVHICTPNRTHAG